MLSLVNLLTIQAKHPEAITDLVHNPQRTAYDSDPTEADGDGRR